MNVLVLCLDENRPYGGIRKLYRHVDLLNRNGFHAEIVHATKGFRCTWFENETPVSYINDDRSALQGQDTVLVVPEVYGPGIAEICPGLPKVIFNQNGYYTFMQYSFDKADLVTPYRSADVVGVLTVSEDSQNYLKAAFPDIDVQRIHYGIDETLFQFSDAKKRRIAFMPRKNEHDARQVINMLKFRGKLADWEFVPIEGKSEKEVAAVLHESMIFLSFGHPEGFGLPPAEAMACGCVAVGYHGMGGREFFRPEFSSPVDHGDILSFTLAVEQAIDEERTNPEAFRAKGRQASQFILKEYSRQREESDIVSYWQSMPGRLKKASAPVS